MVAIDRDALRRAIDEHHRAVQLLRQFLAARRAEEDPDEFRALVRRCRMAAISCSLHWSYPQTKVSVWPTHNQELAAVPIGDAKLFGSSAVSWAASSRLTTLLFSLRLQLFHLAHELLE